jgi:hypothetical protein
MSHDQASWYYRKRKPCLIGRVGFAPCGPSGYAAFTFEVAPFDGENMQRFVEQLMRNVTTFLAIRGLRHLLDTAYVYLAH